MSKPARLARSAPSQTPPAKRLREDVIQFRLQKKAEQLFDFYKQVVVRRIEASPGKEKRQLRLFEDEILVDLEPKTLRDRALFWRTLYEAKRAGRPRADEQAREIEKLKKTKSWGQIGKKDHRQADAARHLLRRYKLRTGQKPS